MSTLDTVGQERSSRTAAEWLWPLLPIGVSVFSLSALVYFHLYHDRVSPSSVLQAAIAGIYRTFGLAPSVLFFLLVLTWSSIWFATGRLDRPLVRLSRLAGMAVMLGVFLNLGDGGVTPAFHKGQIGAWLASALVSAIGYLPSIVLVWAVTFAALLLATDFFFSDSFERLRARAPAMETGVEAAVTDHLRGLAHLPVAASLAVPMASSATDAVGERVDAEIDDPVDTAEERPDEPAAAWPTAARFEPAASSRTAGDASSDAAEDLSLADLSLVEAIEPEPATAAPRNHGGDLAASDGSDAAAAWSDGGESGSDPGQDTPADEPIVDIPRPEPEPAAPRAAAEDPAPRQQALFPAPADEELIAEATELVAGARRVTATLLQRRLRIDYAQALDLMAQLAARGVVELDADASQGRVVV